YPIATPAIRYQDNLAVNTAAAKVDAAPKIIPTPAEVKYRKGTATLDNNWKISYAGRLTSEAKYFAEQLKAAGLTLAVAPLQNREVGDVVVSSSKTIELRVDPSVGGSEAYKLDIGADKITVIGSDNAGA